MQVSQVINTCPQIFSRMTEHIQRELKEVQAIILTSNIWTSKEFKCQNLKALSFYVFMTALLSVITLI